MSRSSNAASTLAALESLFQETGNGEVLALAREVSMFGEWVRELRLAARFTQGEVAKRAGLSRTTVQNVENGLVGDGPRLATVFRIMRVCGYRMEFLATPLNCRAGKAEAFYNSATLADLLNRDHLSDIAFAPANGGDDE